MTASAQLFSAFSGGGAGIMAGAQLENGLYQGQVAKNNQYIANQNADLALYKGTQAVNASQQATAQTVGKERAGYGAGNIEVNSGTALQTQMDTARIGSIDAQTITQNAQRSAWGYQQQAAMFGAQSKADVYGGLMSGAGSLLGGGSNFASKWNSLRNTGALPQDINQNIG